MAALFEPPKMNMTRQDWQKVHCGNSTTCHNMKAKALGPPEYSVSTPPRTAHARARGPARGGSGRGRGGHRRARRAAGLTLCVSWWQGVRSLVVRMGPPDNVAPRPCASAF